MCHFPTIEMWVSALIVDTRLVPLMLLRVWGIPSLGIVSTKILVILLGLWMVVVSSLCCEGGNAMGDEGKLCGFHDCVLCLFRGSFFVILLILVILVVAGDKVSEEWDGLDLTASSRMISSLSW